MAIAKPTRQAIEGRPCVAVIGRSINAIPGLIEQIRQSSGVENVCGWEGRRRTLTISERYLEPTRLLRRRRGRG
jgi:hypothetical protein